MSSTTTYENVKLAKSDGKLTLSDTDLSFEATGGKTLKIPWKNVSKHQMNPKSHAKALLKIVFAAEDKAAKMFQMESRQVLERIHKDVQKRLQSFPDEGARFKPKKDAVAGANGDTGGEGGSSSASAAMDGSSKSNTQTCKRSEGVYGGVTFRNVVGALHLLDDQIEFQAETKTEASSKKQKLFSLPYKEISKQQSSPPKVAKCMLKLIKTTPDSKPITLEVSSREMLDQLATDVQTARTQFATTGSGKPKPKKKDPPATTTSVTADLRTETSDGTIVYSQVEFKSTTGTLTLTSDQLTFATDKNSKSVKWSKLSKCQGNPASHAKVLMKVVLNDDSNMLFTLTDRTTQQQLKDDLATKMDSAKNAPAKDSTDKKKDNKQEDSTKNEAAASGEAASSSSMYKGVKFGSQEGTLTLTKDDIFFDANNKRYSWGDLSKHQCSPPKIAKPLLKLVLASQDKPVTFQMVNRDDLNRINKDIATRLQDFKDNEQQQQQQQQQPQKSKEEKKERKQEKVAKEETKEEERKEEEEEGKQEQQEEPNKVDEEVEKNYDQEQEEEDQATKEEDTKPQEEPTVPDTTKNDQDEAPPSPSSSTSANEQDEDEGEQDNASTPDIVPAVTTDEKETELEPEPEPEPEPEESPQEVASTATDEDQPVEEISAASQQEAETSDGPEASTTLETAKRPSAVSRTIAGYLYYEKTSLRRCLA